MKKQKKREKRMKYYDLTTPQQNICNLQKFYEDTAIANICGAVFYHEEHDTQLLQKAINQIIKEQTALRLRFIESKRLKKHILSRFVTRSIHIA